MTTGGESVICAPTVSPPPPPPDGAPGGGGRVPPPPPGGGGGGGGGGPPGAPPPPPSLPPPAAPPPPDAASAPRPRRAPPRRGRGAPRWGGGGPPAPAEGRLRFGRQQRSAAARARAPTGASHRPRSLRRVSRVRRLALWSTRGQGRDGGRGASGARSTVGHPWVVRRLMKVWSICQSRRQSQSIGDCWHEAVVGRYNFCGKHNTDESKREKHPAPLSVGRHPRRPVCRSRMNNNATALSSARHEELGRGPGNAHPPPPSLPLFPPSSGVPPAAACRLVPRHRSHAACGSRQHAWALAVKLRA